ncbi:hypothetical protein DL771_002430 [Monosporascus sp. 5C6A]|nr:hypothetical protein DL771_002430 [Monosporascus sp. 5C6A]
MALGLERYHELAQWVEQGGGSLNPAVEIYHDEVTKGSFRVRDGCQIEEGDAVVTLPLSRSLSFLNAVSGHPDMPAIPYSSIAKPENSPYFPREFLEKTPPHVTLECFSHIEDSLVVSLYETISRGAATENGGVGVCDIMQGSIPAGLKEKIIDALGSKLSMDLEEIEAHDPQYAASNRNQRLALQYREQCKKVLERALTTLEAHIGE